MICNIHTATGIYSGSGFDESLALVNVPLSRMISKLLTETGLCYRR